MVDIGLVELYDVRRFHPLKNLNNHRIHSATKIAQRVRERISNLQILTDISCGNGLGFIPSAVDGASSHSGKLSLEVRKTKHLLENNWSPMKFEEVADEIDKKDI